LLMARRRSMRDHVADDENGGTAGDLFDEIGQFIKGTDGRTCVLSRHPREYADRSLRGTTGGDEPLRTEGAAVIPM